MLGLRWVPLDDFLIVPLIIAGAVLGLILQRLFLTSIAGMFLCMVLSMTPPLSRPEEIILMDGDRGAALVVAALVTLFPLVPGLVTWALGEVFRNRPAHWGRRKRGR
jgi:hypothetical protein